MARNTKIAPHLILFMGGEYILMFSCVLFSHFISLTKCKNIIYHPIVDYSWKIELSFSIKEYTIHTFLTLH